MFHSFVNLFAGGRSDSKTILFFVYLLLLSLFLFYKKPLFTKIKPQWGVFSLGLFYLYGLVSHFFLSRLYSISPTAFSITGNNGELSSTTLTHIHEAKGALGYLLSKVGFTHFERLDAGGAFLGLFPLWWLFVGAALLITTLCFSFIGFKKLSHIYEQKSIRYKLLFLFGYAIVSFSLVKTALDGGILTPSILSIILAIVLFFRFHKQKDTRALLLCYFGLSLLVSFSVLYFSDWAGGLALMQASAVLMLLVFLILFLYKAPKKIYLFSALLLFSLSWWLASVRDREIYHYGATNISIGDRYFSYNTHLHKLEDTTANSETTISALAKAAHKNLSYGPVAVPGKTCAEGGLLTVGKATFLTKEAFVPEKNDSIRFVVKERTETALGWENQVSIVMPACLPEPLTVIDDILRKQNVNFYVMVNPVFYDESVGR